MLRLKHHSNTVLTRYPNAQRIPWVASKTWFPSVTKWQTRPFRSVTSYLYRGFFFRGIVPNPLINTVVANNKIVKGDFKVAYSVYNREGWGGLEVQGHFPPDGYVSLSPALYAPHTSGANRLRRLPSYGIGCETNTD